MNQIEIWFGIITKQAIRRGTFVSINHLVQRIRTYVEHWNTHADRSSGLRGHAVDRGVG